jgi:hypothetical protein
MYLIYKVQSDSYISTIFNIQLEIDNQQHNEHQINIDTSPCNDLTQL